MRKWYHEVSTEWLVERRSVITATEISKLIPELKRFKKAGGTGIAPGFAALWAEKMTDTEPDPSAFGPAARGHICEPWAVKAWNAQHERQMNHWDDVLIKRDGVGFSPDALDVPCLIDTVSFTVDDGEGLGMTSQDGLRQDAPWELLEIKSYDPGHHMKCCLKDRMEQDELMQIAVPFIVCPTMKKAHLIFFCPDAPISMKEFVYTRDDLKDLISIAEEVIACWNETCVLCTEFASANQELQALCSDDEIWAGYLIETADDPMQIDNVFMLKG